MKIALEKTTCIFLLYLGLVWTWFRLAFGHHVGSGATGISLYHLNTQEWPAYSSTSVLFIQSRVLLRESKSIYFTDDSAGISDLTFFFEKLQEFSTLPSMSIFDRAGRVTICILAYTLAHCRDKAQAEKCRQLVLGYRVSCHCIAHFVLRVFHGKWAIKWSHVGS